MRLAESMVVINNTGSIDKRQDLISRKTPQAGHAETQQGCILAVGTVTEKPAWQMKTPNLDLKSRFKTIICPSHESGDCGKWKGICRWKL